MHEPSVKKLLFIGGILTLMLAAFIAGGIAMSSAHAASPNTLNSQSKCTAQNNPECKDEHSTPRQPDQK